MSTPQNRDQVAQTRAQIDQLKAKLAEQKTGSWESWIEGPKYLKAEIEKAIINWGLTREHVREDRGWFRTTVYFKVSGNAGRVQQFRDKVVKWINEANAED